MTTPFNSHKHISRGYIPSVTGAGHAFISSFPFLKVGASRPSRPNLAAPVQHCPRSQLLRSSPFADASSVVAPPSSEMVSAFLRFARRSSSCSLMSSRAVASATSLMHRTWPRQDKVAELGRLCSIDVNQDTLATLQKGLCETQGLDSSAEQAYPAS